GKPASRETLDGYLAEDATGAIRLLSRDLFTVEGGSLRRTPREDLLPSGRSIRQLAADRSGAIWIGSESSGLLRFTPNGFSSFGPEDGLPDHHIRSLFETPAGALQGLANLDVARWTP